LDSTSIKLSHQCLQPQCITATHFTTNQPMLLPNTNHQPKLLLAQPSLKQGTLPRQTFTPSSSQNQSHCPYDKLT
jgi:hypothetical protein